MVNGYSTDIDALETKEWLDSLKAVLDIDGPERAQFIVEKLNQHLGSFASTGSLNTPYCNTIDVSKEAIIPNETDVARKVSALIRWNALAMVLRAGKIAPELGGHIASYASSACLYEIGFDYFFRAPSEDKLGDLVFIQGHSSPGIYARSFLEGRLQEKDLEHFRQEASGKGLSSYPHPWLMPDYWQFPTVSMGLGPIQAIYQARFIKYLENRELLAKSDRKVWAFIGDGETDEPESLGCINVATREGLDNLIFVINCNLQRLDGPVRGNGSIIQELEARFRGADWHVIKVIWGSKWNELFEADKSGLLLKRMSECVDGDYQTYKARDGAYVREHFFGKYPELLKLVEHLTDDEIWHLNRGGHDPQKVYAAYFEAMKSQKPVVILAKTVKGYGMGAAGEGQNITHQKKKMTIEELKIFRDRFELPLSDEAIEKVPFYRPPEDSPEIQYLKAKRNALNGFLPKRVQKSIPLNIPAFHVFEPLFKATGERHISTTMAFVRLLNILLKHQELRHRIVPMVPDESRTFGMEGMFRQYGIYSHVGQLYTPEDSEQLMYYKEAKDGQVLEEGLNEAGAFSSWLAAATSYENHQLPMIPFYIYYSMFGFQRIGDLAYAAGDMRARGFLLGATSGRTTLAGEGLQHCDGHSHILSSTIPNCRSYDPTFGYEVAAIIHHGLEEMYAKEQDVFYYITVMNENYEHPEMPEGVYDSIIKGMYLLKPARQQTLKVHLLGSGTILLEVLKAQAYLEEHYQISSDVWSVTSFTELKREAMTLERERRHGLHQKPSYVASCLNQDDAPVVAATDYVRMYADQVRSEIHKSYTVLGTDGFGKSDTRVNLRNHFEVNANAIVLAALESLVQKKQLDSQILDSARQTLQLEQKPNPMVD